MAFDPRHPVGPAQGNELRYSDDQPRDEHGRFGSGSAVSEKANSVQEHEAAMKYHVKQARLHEAAAQTAKNDGSKMAHQQAADKHLTAASAHDAAAKQAAVEPDRYTGAVSRNASRIANEASKHAGGAK